VSHNPYTPPESSVADQARPPGSPWKAIGLGLLTDIGGTMAASMVLAIVYGITMGAQGMSAEEMEAAMRGPFLESGISTIATLVGLGFSVAGGYVCARVQRAGLLAVRLRAGRRPALLAGEHLVRRGAGRRRLGPDAQPRASPRLSLTRS
jgi:hypothetical protein